MTQNATGRPDAALDRRVPFHPLTFVTEGPDEIVVGRPGTDTYAVLPADGAALLRRMADGDTPHRASAWHAETYGEPVDIADFLDTLRELGFVAEHPVVQGPAKPVSFRRLGRAVFSPAAWTAYVLLVLATAAALVREPALRPAPDQVFFTGSLVSVQLVLLVGQTVGIAWHEAFHVLSGRRLGLPCRLSVGRRMYFVVFETTLEGLLGVEKRRRVLPFLAGMVGDVLMYCGLTLGAAATRGPDGTPGWPGRLLLALAFLTILRFTWQFYLFLRTDLYYLLAAALGCHDLHGATDARLRNAARRLLRRPPALDESAWSDRDRRMARWYVPFYGTGALVLTATVAAALAPIAVEFAHRVRAGVADGVWGARFWDSAASAASAFVPLGVVLALGVRDRLRARRASSSTS
ncbi:hypothetical protein GCM10010358_13830 [Streptomyces minutiscleroticus]|uniref:Uncharacterized protein n=1 Tax=Streptomyces minutiscleroticus TaxID=68238 RepID=A0A918NE38_9ACTN|nr:hypothetical protein [Streptomyces minutiscleroticus]GGX60504.1 hypothetical protein GCM10010358_13830 [Streptomyces minutiscleroticus]